MSSSLIEYLLQEREAELVARQQQREATLVTEFQQREAEFQQREAVFEARLQELQEITEQHMREQQVETLQDGLTVALALKFPDAPLRLSLLVQQIDDPDTLHQILLQIPDTPDLGVLEQRLRAAIRQP